jgi:peptidoglycan/xylan/chitin deacetylase (PgdA/CDA1 family)
MTPLRHTHKLRALIPQSAREQLYEWHPGRDRRWRRHAGVQCVQASSQAVLTLDDGPDEDATPAVLDALDAVSARATFFMLGSQLPTHVEIAREAVRRGHEVGLHGFEHHRHDRLTAAGSHEDTVRGYEAIGNALGVSCRWYRPPYGRMASGSATACGELGMTPVYWSAWGHDWEDVDARRIADVALSQLDDGAILLLHDSARHGRRPSARPTAEAIPLVAEWAADRDIALVTLGEATENG